MLPGQTKVDSKGRTLVMSSTFPQSLTTASIAEGKRERLKIKTGPRFYEERILSFPPPLPLSIEPHNTESCLLVSPEKRRFSFNLTEGQRLNNRMTTEDM
ncbi:hypothetical protein CEXT_373151 [Caerostris extrusa]|uniref:Uncharacterized protein n=1 Tax=Caerostris extrusa TaxID=172846 RepID=A0AAV4UBF6_CAEEX|nr:hypothetical protein CEXT_373151 [Caerostris extrusa]